VFFVVGSSLLRGFVLTLCYQGFGYQGTMSGENGGYLVTVGPDGNPDTIASEMGMIKDRRLADSPQGTIWLFKVAPSTGRQSFQPQELLARLRAYPGVTLAEENQEIKLVPKML